MLHQGKMSQEGKGRTENQVRWKMRKKTMAQRVVKMTDMRERKKTGMKGKMNGMRGKEFEKIIWRIQKQQRREKWW